MRPGIGDLDIFPSIWGRECSLQAHIATRDITDYSSLDWAGGPGDSIEDVRWLNERMERFFSTVPMRESI